MNQSRIASVKRNGVETINGCAQLVGDAHENAHEKARGRKRLSGAPRIVEGRLPVLAMRRIIETQAGGAMSKEAMRAEAERLVKEAMAKNTVAVKRGATRIETKCGKCGAPNRVSAAPGETRVEYTCKECGHRQKAL